MIRTALTGFAVDLGGTKTAAARFDSGRIVKRLQVATDPAAGFEAQMDQTAALLRELGYRHGDPTGVAVAGRVTSDGVWHAVNRGTLQKIENAALQDTLHSFLGDVAVCNDAAAAALAEAHFGAGNGASNFAYLTVSTGIGGGIVLNGNLVESANGLAGHVGFVSSPLGHERCGSGRMGTVESVAGGRALAAAATDLGHSGFDARGVFNAAVAGEDWATKLIDRSASAVAILIADLTSILGLDRVAIGGGIGLASGYIDQLRIKLEKEPVLFRTDIKQAALGVDSGLMGALLLARLRRKR